MPQGTIEGVREERNSDEKISLLPYTPDDGDDGDGDGRMERIGIEVAHCELSEEEVEAIQRNARDRIIEEAEEAYRWGRRTFHLPPMKLAGVLSREPRTEYAHEQVQGLDVGTRRVVFEERINLTSGDGLLEISIETASDSNDVETITVNTLGGTTWVGHP